MSTISSPTPALRVGLPDGVNPESVRSRQQAMIAAGTPELIAGALAATAAEQQHLRDQKLKLTAVIEQEPVTDAVVRTHKQGVKVPASKPPRKIAVPTGGAEIVSDAAPATGFASPSAADTTVAAG